MRDGNWFYAEFKRLDEVIKNATNPQIKESLNKELDELHDEFYDMDFGDDDE